MKQRRLPSYAVEAYDILHEATSETDDEQGEISPDAARAALEDADEEFTVGGIDHILDLLYNVRRFSVAWLSKSRSGGWPNQKTLQVASPF